MNNEVVINTTRLTKYYGAQLGISEVDLAVNRGEVFGYLGPTAPVKPRPSVRCWISSVHRRLGGDFRP